MVQTTSINIFNLCVPCENHCRYCLLSWDGTCLGIDYDRSVVYARNFHQYLKMNHPNISFIYYYGYSMEHPRLLESIKFMQETNSPGGEFLQFDGMKMRSREELYKLLSDLKEIGIKLLDFTFYGLKEYHNKFAGRHGDYELMMESIDVSLEVGLDVEVGISVTKENLNQLEELVNLFENKNVKLFLFTPHTNGRGITLINSKITIDDYNSLSNNVKKYLNRNTNKTPREWLHSDLKEVDKRVLMLSLMPNNIERLENQSFEETIKELEKLDEDYYKVVPSFKLLLNEYVDENDNRLYSSKDLYLIYRKRFIKEHNLKIMDISDERYSGSIRI